MKTSKSLTEAEIAELPTLPEEWEWARLGELVNDIVVGYVGPITQYLTDDLNKGVRFLSTTHIGDNQFLNHKEIRYVTNEFSVNNKKSEVIAGDIIVARHGDSGKCCIIPLYIKKAQVSNAVIIRPNNELFVNLYILYSFGYLKRYLQKKKVGGVQQVVNTKTMEAFPFPLPPLPEQRAIVSKIEQLFSELDNGISNLKLAQEQLKVYRQAVLKKAFEGDWNTVELQVISNAVGGFAFKSKDFKDGGKYQIIRIGNVQPGNLRLDKSPVFVDNIETKIIDKYLLKQDDVVITLTGTRKKRDYGFTALVNKENLLLNQRIAFLRFNNKCLPKFFLYYSWTEPFKNQFFASETGNVGQGNVGMKAIQSTAIPLPSLPEQQAIVQEIETRLSVCDKIEQDIETNLEKAEALRQSILKKAFEGKLLNERELAAVRGAEDWEPAEVLLEKIKAGKAGNGKKMKHETEKLKSIIQEDKGIIQQATLQAFEQINK